ncbi:hypothetical protein WA1_25205 [Scytonema hofmannii PCC 7110]|uniref:Uncharacterized protein n=1 Tax=Scytonema hofmannii PCC 7110 TaxID=128403 RepID=A0A139X8B1_9CYAN|nr:hypothetical protein [Scytonema hofmannii]KYC40916.1 hypothetical protein WA1_25205 [Scytonema hofmannii PCC 7110]
MPNFKEMSIAELKEYLSTHRHDDKAFSAALGELITRNRGALRYPANLPLEDVGKIIQEKLNQVD